MSFLKKIFKNLFSFFRLKKIKNTFFVEQGDEKLRSASQADLKSRRSSVLRIGAKLVSLTQPKNRALQKRISEFLAQF